MNEKEYNKLVTSAGNRNRYQYILFIIVFFIYGTSEFITISIPYIEIRPLINENNITKELTYEICQDYKNSNKTMDIIIEKTTIVSDLEIYCDQSKTTLIGTSIFIGILIGSLFNIDLCEHLGRKNTIILAGLIYIASIFSVALVSNYYFMVIILGINGFSYIILVLSAFLLMNETVDPKLVSIFSSFIYSAYNLFGVIYPLLFYFYQKWWYLFVTVGTFFTLIYVIFIYYAVESPQYLYSKGKINELRDTLDLIKIKNDLKDHDKNHRSINECLIPQEIQESKNTEKNYSVLDLIRLKSQRINFLCISWVWFVCSFIFYGIAINIKNLNGNIYFRGIEMNLIEVVVVILSGFIANIPSIGRKTTILIFLFLSSISFISLIFTDNGSNLYFYLLVIGRFSLSSVFSIIYYVSNEIYPTPLRVKGLSMNSLISRFGGLTAPFAIEFIDFQNLLIIYSGLVIVSFIFSIFLEETLNNSMKNFIPEEQITAVK